jgi:hypothetical protein
MQLIDTSNTNSLDDGTNVCIILIMFYLPFSPSVLLAPFLYRTISPEYYLHRLVNVLRRCF